MVESQIVAPLSSSSSPAPTGSVRRLAAKGAVWTFAGYGTKQILRFGNRMILARLLMPEIFGLSALVDTFMLGLTLFSDIGINFSIIQNKRGDEPSFLNTGWTLQVLRGLLLGLLACLFAIPVSRFFEEPILAIVLPIAGLTAVAQGFNSTKLALANRKLQMRQLTLIEVSSYVLGLVVMIVWALNSATIWALVVGNLVTMWSQMILSHVALEGQRNGFAWDKEVISEIWKFGRWIFVSTSLAFLASQSDKLIVGKLTSTTFLGIYAIAFVLANMVTQGLMQIGAKVFFPSYSKLVRDNPKQLYNVVKQARIAMTALNWMAAILFFLTGPLLVPILFGESFADAGWMLQIISLGTLVGVLSVSYDQVLVAKGQTYAVAGLFAIQFGIQVICLLVGARLAGEFGIIVGIALVGWLIYPFKAAWMIRQKLWQPEVDLPVIAGATTIIVLTMMFIG